MARIEHVEQTLFRVVGVLEHEQIPYAVMGGLAVRVYALPRATQDVDITISLDFDRLETLRDKLFEAGCSVPPVYDSGWLDRVAGMPLFKVARNIGRHTIDVDIFVADSHFQDSLIARRNYIELEKQAVAIASPEDLVLLKLIAGRPRDLVDVQDLLFTLGQLDEDYLRDWAAELGVGDQLEEALRDAQQ